MKYSEELKFLGGLYNAVKDKHGINDTPKIFVEKMQIAIDKGIISDATAYGVQKMLNTTSTQDIESLIDEIMEEKPLKSSPKTTIDKEKFGDDLKYIGTLYATISEANIGNSSQLIFKEFIEKLDVSVRKGIISQGTANCTKKMIEEKDMDSLIISVMNSKTNARGRSTQSDPCYGSSYGRSSC